MGRSRVALGSIAVSVVLAAVLAYAHLRFRSELALAQAADSLADVVTASGLLYSMWVAAQPADEGHPGGHHRAEPIAALVTAVLSGVLAAEVVRSAIVALVGRVELELDWPLAAAFGLKVVAKLGIAGWATHELKSARSPALEALRFDAGNDVLFSLLGIAGYVSGRWGASYWDPVLAIPVGLWIAASGLRLARSSIGLLMGEAASPERHRELAGVVEGAPGVRSVHDLAARHDGAGLAVIAHVVVDPKISVHAAHDIATGVERLLLTEPDVVHAMVHIDVAD